MYLLARGCAAGPRPSDGCQRDQYRVMLGSLLNIVHAEVPTNRTNENGLTKTVKIDSHVTPMYSTSPGINRGRGDHAVLRAGCGPLLGIRLSYGIGFAKLCNRVQRSKASHVHII